MMVEILDLVEDKGQEASSIFPKDVTDMERKGGRGGEG